MVWLEVAAETVNVYVATLSEPTVPVNVPFVCNDIPDGKEPAEIVWVIASLSASVAAIVKLAEEPWFTVPKLPAAVVKAGAAPSVNESVNSADKPEGLVTLKDKGLFVKS